MPFALQCEDAQLRGLFSNINGRQLRRVLSTASRALLSPTSLLGLVTPIPSACRGTILLVHLIASALH